MTPHIEAKKEEIAKTVIMPGDPLRAKYIAENYLENYKLVSKVRNIYAYTGYYKGIKITVMASGFFISEPNLANILLKDTPTEIVKPSSNLIVSLILFATRSGEP